MTVEGGSGCLKELSIPAALLRNEVKAICPTSKSKDTDIYKHSGLLSLVLPTDGGDPLVLTLNTTHPHYPTAA